MQFGPVAGNNGEKTEFKDFATCYEKKLKGKGSPDDRSASYLKA